MPPPLFGIGGRSSAGSEDALGLWRSVRNAVGRAYRALFSDL